MTTIRTIIPYDIRFPTSETLAGSDAMHPDPDYSAAYVIVHTDGPFAGHGLTFTLGRGTEVVCAAITALAPLVVGWRLEDIVADWPAFWRRLTSDSQLRWIGPEKGAIHMATGALINALWDLWAKQEGKPVWQLLADMTPDEVVGCIDFRYITDALTPEEARDLLAQQAPSKAIRLAELRASGYPAYTTGAGWLGYSDEKMRQICRDSLAKGWQHFKLKVGGERDAERAQIMREEIGPDCILMLDANQVWDVNEAIQHMHSLAQYQPYWLEEPTSPDEVLGLAAIASAIAPIRVATGEMVQNRIIFKQLFQARAIGVCQIDACRVGGVNEVLAILLMAAKFGVPVCPHAGGVGLCEYVQHLSMFDYLAVSGLLEGRMIEYAPHLHEHFVHPAIIEHGHYLLPTHPGFSIEMPLKTINEYGYPLGSKWYVD